MGNTRTCSECPYWKDVSDNDYGTCTNENSKIYGCRMLSFHACEVNTDSKETGQGKTPNTGKSRWLSTDYKNFKPGDIICNNQQDFICLVIKVEEEAIWCVGLVLAAFTENGDRHPLFPILFTDIADGTWDGLLRLGNLKDYEEYVGRVQQECNWSD